MEAIWLPSGQRSADTCPRGSEAHVQVGGILVCDKTDDQDNSQAGGGDADGSMQAVAPFRWLCRIRRLAVAVGSRQCPFEYIVRWLSYRRFDVTDRW